jgi:predicted metalloprotease
VSGGHAAELDRVVVDTMVANFVQQDQSRTKVTSNRNDGDSSYAVKQAFESWRSTVIQEAAQQRAEQAVVGETAEGEVVLIQPPITSTRSSLAKKPKFPRKKGPAVKKAPRRRPATGGLQFKKPVSSPVQENA